MKHGMFTSTALITLSAFMGSTVFAEESATPARAGFDEVIVTAQKQEQSLIEVPINISVVDQSRIDLLAADDIEDLGNFIPGLQVQAQSLNAPSYALRGVVSDGGRPRVGIFQNGIAIGNPGYAATLAIFDMERIEIVKGPQATLFNQGALVGGINYIQKTASTEGNSGRLDVEGGDYNFIRVEGHANAAVNDKFAARVALQYKNLDGYVPNLGNSPALMGQQTLALRTALHFEPVSRVTADVFLNYQRDDSTGTQFKSGFFTPEGGDLSPYTATAMNINADQVRDKLGNDREFFYVTAKVSVDLTDSLTFTSLTDYRDLASSEAWDSDGALFDMLQFYQDDEAEVFNQEIRLNFNNGGRLSAFAGGNFASVDEKGFLIFSTDEARLQALFAPTIAGAIDATPAQVAGLLALNGVPGGANFGNILDPLQFSALGALQGNLVPLNPAHLERQDTTDNRKSYDLFADVTFDLTDRLSLTAGGRFTSEELSTSATDSLVRGNAALGGAANAVFFNQGFLFSRAALGERSFSDTTDGAFTWRFNAAYRLTDDINTWFAYGRGLRPETLSASGDTFETVDAEILNNYEVGMFGRFFDDRLQVTSSLYYGRYQNFQTTRFEPENGVFVVENSGAATQYGFEVDGLFAASENILLGATYAYTYSRYDNYDRQGNALQLAGNSFRISPENSFSLFADVTIPAGAAGSFRLTPSYIWKDSHFFEDDNGFNFATNGAGGFDRIPEAYPDGQIVQESQEAYGIANMRLGFDSANERWGAYFTAENLFDKEYLIDVGNIGGAFGLHTIIRGKPRIVKGGLYVKF